MSGLLHAPGETVHFVLPTDLIVSLGEFYSKKGMDPIIYPEPGQEPGQPQRVETTRFVYNVLLAQTIEGETIADTTRRLLGVA